MKKLLIVDIQKGFINKNNQFLIEKIEKLVSSGKFDQIVATKFVNNQESQFARFLNYNRMYEKEEQELALALPNNAVVVTKTSFVMADVGGFSTDDEVYICGTDYDACVLAICFQLFDHNIQPHILIDYVGSHSDKPIPKSDFEKICVKNFGKQSIVKL